MPCYGVFVILAYTLIRLFTCITFYWFLRTSCNVSPLLEYSVDEINMCKHLEADTTNFNGC